MGIEELKDFKEVMDVPLALYMAVDKAKQNDGKVDLMDLPLLLDPVMKIPAAAENFSAALGQWKAASAEARVAYYDSVKASFDIADDKLEEKVEAGIAVLVHMGKLLS